MAVVVCLPYPASFGPAAYAAGRLWMHQQTFESIYSPLTDAVYLTPLWPAFQSYYFWWQEAAMRADGYPTRKYWPLYSTRRPFEY